MASVRATINGLVQGVGFRYYTRAEARNLGLSGYVRNLPGGKAVETEAEGNRADLEKLVEFLTKGPPMARVDNIDIEWADYSGQYGDFSIRR